MKTLMKKILKKYGRELIIRKRVETIVNDEVTFTYSSPSIIRGQVSYLTGYAESWERPGLFIRADVLTTFLPNTDVNIGDLIKIDDEWFEVVELAKRTTGERLDWIECLLRRRESA